jgi:hypothetical protein
VAADSSEGPRRGRQREGGAPPAATRGLRRRRSFRSQVSPSSRPAIPRPWTSAALFGRTKRSGRAGDVGSALDAFAAFERDEDKRQRWMHALAERTAELVAKPEVAAAIEKLAESLLDTPTLEGDRLECLLRPMFSLARRSAV